ncbi:efflux RND transporter periplasmic adaptor subunit [Marinomonas ostreistagni]|uniref:efflux RND transporter periplasmic adaptor subunit n=1 Tax=Marinomonas ostreistagni TaxID=359209 RepID=UPI0019526BF8|nr:efflux RND transporter periplasmic adaptor subunit [Marinomonas ostreistagni]MBM6549623.1 efflux RND transporter periplasmic adaptor subunit [Marinomonas ostreistagni]
MGRKLPWLVFGLAVALFIGVYAYIQYAISQNQAQFSRSRPAAPETALDVTVVNVTPSSHAASLTAVGLAQPNYNLSLTSQVSGEVTTVSPNLEAGAQVKQGEVLAQLTNLSLLTELASAKNELAASRLALKQEQRQVEQANAEWQAAGLEGQPDSDLVLREPQLAAAQADVDAAESALALAQDNVEKLTIRAPFDGVIAAEAISLGTYLSSGAEVATLYSSDRVEIALQLSQQDWQKLPTAQTMLEQHWPAQVRAVDGQHVWPGYVKQAGLHVDTETGLRSLYVAVDNPLAQQPSLLLGSYVRITLSGKQLENLWQLPNSALSQKSQIWYVDADNRLANFDTTPRFVDQEYVYVDVPESLQGQAQQVLTHPYNSYLKGMLVNPVEWAQE